MRNKNENNPVGIKKAIFVNKEKNLFFITFLDVYGTLVIFIGLFIICSVASPYFLTLTNLLNVVRQISVVGIVSIGMTFVILTAGIDLSVGSVLACSTLLMAGLKEFNPFVVFLIVLLFGIFAGLINGVVITKFNAQPFVVTLGFLSAYVGLGLAYSGGHPIIGSPKMLAFLGQGKVFRVPVQVIVFVVIAILASLILERTPFGRYVYAVGGNPEASRLSGVAVKKIIIFVYMISGLLSALAGAIMATHLNVGEASLGTGIELDAIAAVAIGGTSLQGGKGKILGTVMGVLIIGVLSNFLNLINVPGYTQKFFKGIIIVGAVILQSFSEEKG